LFQFVYGNTEITEAKLQNALAQFIRSIQSFDSKYDVGRALVTSDLGNFSNLRTKKTPVKIYFYPIQYLIIIANESVVDWVATNVTEHLNLT
jgi:hypothetical protein